VAGLYALPHMLICSGHPIAAVLNMLVEEPVGFTVVTARYGLGHRRARQLLLDALDRWPMVLGGVCKEIDPDAVAKAHARLAA